MRTGDMTIIQQQRRFAAIIFDLDDTLYRIDEIPQKVKENIIGSPLMPINTGDHQCPTACAPGGVGGW